MLRFRKFSGLTWINGSGWGLAAAAAMAPNIHRKGGAVIRSELVQKLCDDHPDLTGKEIERVVTAFFESVITQLQHGGRVELRGFGAFSTRDRDARKGRNPRTGDTVDVDAKRVPYFKPGKEMRERLNLQDGAPAEA
jgi:integration host factor subunit beta